MGVDVTHIIRHNFKQFDNHEASVSFVKETIDMLCRKLFLSLDDANEMRSSFYYDEESNEILFRVSCLEDVELTLRDGFWEVESYVHFCQLVMHKHGWWLRKCIGRLAFLLGESEVWHAAEYHTWNNALFEEEWTFDKWIEYAQNTEEGISEFDVQDILSQGDVHIPEYKTIYHDALKDLKPEIETWYASLDNNWIINEKKSTLIPDENGIYKDPFEDTEDFKKIEKEAFEYAEKYERERGIPLPIPSGVVENYIKRELKKRFGYVWFPYYELNGFFIL